ncbi:hypothetical protein EV182_008325, partial [Spiromyces aspiralis]
MFNGNWVGEFLSQYEQYSNSLGWNDRQKSTGIRRYLPKMAIAIIAHHPETRSGDWTKVKELLIHTYHVEEEEPSIQDALDDLLTQGLDINQPDAFLSSFSTIANCLNERETTKIALLLKATPISIREKVITNYKEEIQTLDEAIRRVREQVKSHQYYESLTANIKNIHVNSPPTSETTPLTPPTKPKEQDTE